MGNYTHPINTRTLDTLGTLVGLIVSHSKTVYQQDKCKCLDLKLPGSSTGCWIGKKRLEKAMAVASDTMALDFLISWKPFFLDPRLPGGEGKDKMDHYKQKFGADRVAQMLPRMRQTFADEGIPNYSLKGRVGNTMDSHRLLEYALSSGGPAKQDALVERLFHQYFIQGLPLSSRSVLLEAARDVQLDRAAELLDTEDYSEQVWSQVEDAYAKGVSGVPYFRVDGGGRGKEVSGGEPPEVFLKIFRSLKPIPSSLAATDHFGVGSTIAVAGLRSKPEHNAKLGRVVGIQGERVQVELEDGVRIALKPANLERIAKVDDSNTVDCC